MRWIILATLIATRGQAMEADWIVGKGVFEVSTALVHGDATAAEVTDAYLARIAAVDPAIRSVLAINPHARAQAQASDERRAGGRTLGPLDGVPILVKDNIDTLDPMPTTAGSWALIDNVTHRDAPVIAKLRAAGMVILGKTNLSEWANMRSDHSVSGWSAVGGQTRNPYALDRSPCGSSSGSGAAVAASLAPAAIGTETDGSITCPASLAGLVGIKPTVGLLSRTHIVPISTTQDGPGPMTRTVADSRVLLDIMAGEDADDAATTDRRPAPAAAPEPSLRGKTLAVAKFLTGYHPQTDAVFASAVARLRAAGATIVEVETGPDMDAIGKAELTVLLTELKTSLAAYLATTPDAVRVRTLADVIAFNRADPRELAIFGQEHFEQAEQTHGLDDPAYHDALRQSGQVATEALAKMLADTGADALIAPTGGPAWLIDPVNGDHFLGAASTLPAVVRAPHVTVPMGQVSGLPVGLSFIGPRWSDHAMLTLAEAFEATGSQPPLPTLGD